MITGAASGIGRACCDEFIKKGARVIASDIDKQALDALNAEWATAGIEVSAVSVGVAEFGDAERIVAHAVDRNGQMDVLFNSAGITPRMVDPTATLMPTRRLCSA